MLYLREFMLLTLSFVAIGCTNSNVPPSPPGPVPLCYVDFPCAKGQTIRCVTDTTYRALQTFGCAHTCGMPCSGASCEPVDPVQSCPVGQLCVRNGLFDYCGQPDGGIADGGVPMDSSTD